MKKRLLGYYDYTVILTYCGMLSAMTGILWVLHGRFCGAILLLMLAGICDMFDGTVAATKDRTPSEKCFGIQIDSLSDLISFGVLPALFVYALLGGTTAAGFLASVYVLAALIRLAYFNVLEAERQQQTTECRHCYLGVPVTTIAILLPAVYFLYDKGYIRTKALFPALLVLAAVGFLLPIEVRKPRILGKVCLIVLGILEAAALLFLMLGDSV